MKNKVREILFGKSEEEYKKSSFYKYDKILRMIDLSVYSKNRCFNMLDSFKLSD